MCNQTKIICPMAALACYSFICSYVMAALCPCSPVPLRPFVLVFLCFYVLVFLWRCIFVLLCLPFLRLCLLIYTKRLVNITHMLYYVEKKRSLKCS